MVGKKSNTKSNSFMMCSVLELLEWEGERVIFTPSSQPPTMLLDPKVELQFCDHKSFDKSFNWTNTKIEKMRQFMISKQMTTQRHVLFSVGERFWIWGLVKYFNKTKERKKVRTNEKRLQLFRLQNEIIKATHLRARRRAQTTIEHCFYSFALFAYILRICLLFIGVIKVLIRIKPSDGC